MRTLLPAALAVLLLAGAVTPARAADASAVAAPTADVQFRFRGPRVSVRVGDPFFAQSGFGGAFGDPFAFQRRTFQAFPFRDRFGRLCVFVPGLGTFCR